MIHKRKYEVVKEGVEKYSIKKVSNNSKLSFKLTLFSKKLYRKRVSVAFFLQNFKQNTKLSKKPIAEKYTRSQRKNPKKHSITRYIPFLKG
eukprot:snap_masked-scaffold_26-processed-gene-4.79-mRNA-1 protein AED:1.00 eAED:1.00 QI:0/0/0/0/1/1/2/0/90